MSCESCIKHCGLNNYEYAVIENNSICSCCRESIKAFGQRLDDNSKFEDEFCQGFTNSSSVFSIKCNF
jgi:hypothetical protein